MNNTTKFILIGSLVIIGFYLFLEHKAHILGNSQYLLIALFIGMHFLMHAGHGGPASPDGGQGGHGEQKIGGRHHE